MTMGSAQTPAPCSPVRQTEPRVAVAAEPCDFASYKPSYIVTAERTLHVEHVAKTKFSIHC